MADFRPVRQTSDLPPIGAVETNVLDFKGTIFGEDGKGKPDLCKLGKHVAAFANSEGGTVLIGAVENKTTRTLERYDPFSPERAAQIREAYSNAVAQFCSPAPLFDAATIPQDAGAVVAVNVSPCIGQVVGVRKQRTEDAFFFPRRVGLQTEVLRPEQLPMFMVPEIRRIAILLRSIPAREYLWLSEINAMGNSVGKRSYLLGINEAANACSLSGQPPSGDHQVWTIPLDRIESVWSSTDGWHVVYRAWT
jgi:hypothetical protein